MSIDKDLLNVACPPDIPRIEELDLSCTWFTVQSHAHHSGYSLLITQGGNTVALSESQVKHLHATYLSCVANHQVLFKD